jgi:hypothetical protein
LQLLEAGDMRKAAKAMGSGHPPFSGMVLEPDLYRSPAKIGNTIGAQWYRCESFAIEVL